MEYLLLMRGEDMMKMTVKSAIRTSMLALAVGFAGQVNAEDPALSFAPGVACLYFGLDVYVSNCNEHYVVKEFTDRYGNVVRALGAGKGCDLEFVNTSTDATFSTTANGSVYHTRYNSDGTETTSAVGHNVLVFYDTDLPPGVGPSTKQYVGRIVYTVGPAPEFIWTLEKVSGRTVDICAALSE
jgi:hypothetical protein